ncbi:hypothetical protein GCM10009716_22470 [Streptomyces sodiiphilus]|uniref:Uncharacterized protein n=1 Tax=Streptomyces sodiiphilus TaxID=226217 RepID=A0ABN2P4C2_9ACTN
MTSHSGRDDEPREGVVLPPDGGPWDARGERTGPGAPSAGRPWTPHWGPGGQDLPGPPAGSDASAGQSWSSPAPSPPGEAIPSRPPAPRVPPDQAPTQLFAPVRDGHGGQGTGPASFESTVPVPALPRQTTPEPPPGPPAVPPGDEAATQMIPPVTDHGPPPFPGAGSHDEAATRMIPPVTDQGPPPFPGAGSHDEAATRMIPPVTDHGPPPFPGAGSHDEAATRMIPPVTDQGPPPFPGAGSHDEAATRMIPPVTDHGPPPFPGAGSHDEAATRMIPPVTDQGPPPFPGAGSHDEAATRMIPPVTDHGPPPYGGGPADAEATAQMPAIDPESTTRLRTVSPRQGPPPEAGVEETRAMAPVPGDFDQLFRSGQPSAPAAPRPGGRAEARRAAAAAGGGRRSPAVLIGSVVAGCLVVGLALGAAIGGGGDGNAVPPKDPEGAGPVDAGDDAGGGQDAEDTQDGEDAEDTAQVAAEQAQALSTLLEDSNDSRDAVIRSVENIKSCDKLKKAGEDLREAADQRNSLVTRLDELELDALPDSEELTAALVEAWEASADADDYYAAWADEVRENRRRMCRGGQAQHTESLAAANRASGEATAAKERAAELWNPTAREHGLPERAPGQL